MWLEVFFKSKLGRHLRCGAHKLFCSFRKSSSLVVLDNILSESEKVHYTKYTIDYLIVTIVILLKQNLMMSLALLTLEEAVIVMTTILMKQI